MYHAPFLLAFGTEDEFIVCGMDIADFRQSVGRLLKCRRVKMAFPSWGKVKREEIEREREKERERERKRERVGKERL